MPVDIKSIIRQCVKEALLEAFDPTSCGPNPEADGGHSQEDPYQAWNAKMRRMENIDILSGEEKYSKQEPEGPMMAVNLENTGRYAQMAGAGEFDPNKFAVQSFNEIRKQLDPDGTKHDLTLTCSKCGTTHTCRCPKPKRKITGICPRCFGKN